MSHTHQQKLRVLFEQWSGEKPEMLESLPQSGSYRRYYRIHGSNVVAVGVFNGDLRENKAFLTMTRHFSALDIPVPQVLAEGPAGETYLIEDLGNSTLFDTLRERRAETGVFPGSVIELYKRALSILPQIQITASKTFDYSICYPRPAFDRQSMMWDLNYFKYYFLKLARVPFDEQHLENDFEILCNHLLLAESSHFLYRDFQSSNIMVKENNLFFIDYQGGRQGALQYDVASLLWDSKAAIPFEVKQIMLDHYLQVVSEQFGVEPADFSKHYPAFILIRLMQAMGAYGFRGLYEQKTQFLQSIPFALKQIENLLHNSRMPVEVPYLLSVLASMQESPELTRHLRRFKTARPISIDIHSFSYKKMIPQNEHGHGGGYVFDCRCIQNPGNFSKYAKMDGKNPVVAEFLLEGGEAEAYMHQVYRLVDQTIEKYLAREFSDLQVCFGSTLGRYRAVFCAERLGAYLRQKYPQQVLVDITHQELNNVYT